ncbi:lysophospholipid acyltransferase 7-like [Bicyclus anynana]|uniref:Lysophospholipid acyltransferase 7-like n=1 Tax=Bicyclus anynana TaxID=110368 RepID=A0A6J1NHH0_BICAN|nr:lysophospholipid acyltransferase 7-like [Bicyclus anynana]
MLVSGIVYYTSLLVCISLGSNYKKIVDINMKRNYGTGLGILLMCLICGTSVIYSMLMVWGNIIIIKCCDRRFMHQLSFTFTWMLLCYVHLNITNIYVIWLHQTLALKLVGLAFEMCAAQMRSDTKSVGASKANDTDTTPEPTAIDIISYAYFFIGLHKGPYYRWKIFHDHFHESFGMLGDCTIVTEQKLKKTLICALGYWALNYKYSKDLYFDDAFYNIFSAEVRYLYNLPHLTMYFLRHQAVMMMCTSVFTETGFGVYPAKCNPLPGYGPSARLSFLDVAANSTKAALEEEYNFSMIKCYNNEGVIMGPKMRDTMRGWDMPTRYWFWAYIEKSLVKSNKEVRSAFSLLTWTIWAGPSIPRFIIGVTLWVYVHLEAEYASLYDTSGSMKMPWDIGFSIMRLFCLLYLTPCFVLQNTTAVMRYYYSIFWVFHIILFILMLSSIYLQSKAKS